MIFRTLEIKDFLVFRGHNRIAFPATKDGETSLVLVFAANNAGKTTVIKALRFLLYGDKPAGDILNLASVAEIAPGKVLEGWVGATVIVGDKTYTFRRRLRGIKGPGGAIRLDESVLEQVIHERKGDEYVPDEGSVNRLLTSLVPEALFDFFYFQGETLAEKLMHRSPDHSLGEALGSLLKQDKWQQAAEAAAVIRAKVFKEMQELTVANRAYSEKLQLVEGLREKVYESEKQSKAFEEEYKKATADYEELSQRILEISSGKSFEQVARKLAIAQSEADSATRAIAQIEAEMATTVSASRGVPFLSGAYPVGKEILETMRRDNLLPADVADGFLQRLLDQGLCLCGRHLNGEDNSKARTMVEEYRSRALSADVNAGLMDLLNLLDEKVQRSFHRASDDTVATAAKLIRSRKSSLVKKKEVESLAASLGEQLRNSNHAEVKALQLEQDAAVRRREKAMQDRRTADSVLTQRKNMLRTAKEDLAQQGGQKFGPQFEKLKKAHQRSDELVRLIETSLQMLKTSFHTILQHNVSLLYDSVVTDGSKARVSATSLLPAIEQAGSVVHNIGGGQRQLLVLAHIVSLARLRQQLHDELADLGIHLGRLDDQSFFLDSVFAPADQHYAECIAEFLPGKARQVVVLLASQQWQPWVAKHLEPNASRVIRCVLTSPNPPESSRISYGGKDVVLYKKCDAKQLAYSQMEEMAP
jgi:DNA sulfur modification protein DndD